MRIPPRALDVGFAAGSAALTLAVVFGEGLAAASDQTIAGSRWWVLPLMLVPSAALLWRRSHPLATVAGVWVPIALHAMFTGMGAEGLFIVWPAWVSLYALAAYGSRRQLLTGLAVAAVALFVHDWNDPRAWRAGAEAAWSAAWWDLLLFVAPLIGGLVAGTRRTRARLRPALSRIVVSHARSRRSRIRSGG